MAAEKGFRTLGCNEDRPAAPVDPLDPSRRRIPIRRSLSTSITDACSFSFSCWAAPSMDEPAEPAVVSNRDEPIPVLSASSVAAAEDIHAAAAGTSQPASENSSPSLQTRLLARFAMRILSIQQS